MQNNILVIGNNSSNALNLVENDCKQTLANKESFVFFDFIGEFSSKLRNESSSQYFLYEPCSNLNQISLDLSSTYNDFIAKGLIEAVRRLLDPSSSGLISSTYEYEINTLVQALYDKNVFSVEKLFHLHYALKQGTLEEYEKYIPRNNSDLAAKYKEVLYTSSFHSSEKQYNVEKRMYEFITSPSISKILNNKGVITLTEAVASNQNIILNLDPMNIGEAGADFFGQLALLNIYIALNKQFPRNEYKVLINNSSRIFTSTLIDLLSESSALQIQLELKIDYLEQLGKMQSFAIFANTKDYYLFSQSQKDASFLADYFGDKTLVEKLLTLQPCRYISVSNLPGNVTWEQHTL